MTDLMALILDGSTKGFPMHAGPTALGAVGALGLRVLRAETEFPIALLKRSALEHNQAWMGEFLRRTGASLCPHGKTTMAPQLFHRQLADGAWGITLATPQQVRIAYRYGVRRILLANESILPGAVRWLQATLDADPDFDFTCLVDSPEAVARLDSVPGRRPIQVLVELGIPGGRTGARSVQAALAVARAVKASTRLQLRGVECYEGIVGSPDPAADRARIQAWLGDLATLAPAPLASGAYSRISGVAPLGITSNCQLFIVEVVPPG